MKQNSSKVNWGLYPTLRGMRQIQKDNPSLLVGPETKHLSQILDAVDDERITHKRLDFFERSLKALIDGSYNEKTSAKEANALLEEEDKEDWKK